MRIAPYQATCNSLDFGGVMTELNRPVMEDEKLWDQIMELTPLKRWMSCGRGSRGGFYFMAVKTASVQARTFSLTVWRPETAILSGHRVG